MSAASPLSEQAQRHLDALRAAVDVRLAALEAALAEEGIEAAYSKELFRQAFRAGWLAAEAPWLAMIEDRNRVAHTYNERTAEQVRAHVYAAAGPLLELRALLATGMGSAGEAV
jgi:nucleotidyltransferase substrate binding protein (TIGR01987 family)